MMMESKKEVQMSFATAVNCMDGRVQRCVSDYIRSVYCVEYVDTISVAGPVKLFAEDSEGDMVVAILEMIERSIRLHESEVIAVVAHYDCLGNPIEDDIQKEQLDKSVKFIKSKFGQCEVVGLWVGDDWEVEKHCLG